MASSTRLNFLCGVLNRRLLLPNVRVASISRYFHRSSSTERSTVLSEKTFMNRSTVMNHGQPLFYIRPRNYSSLPSHTVIKLPNLSPTMETGTVVSWAKNEGDKLEDGDLLAEIETDKATMAMDISELGYLAKILVPAGTKDIPVGSQLCVVVEDEADIAAFKDFQAEALTAPTPTKAEVTPPAPPPTAVPAAAAVPLSSSAPSPGGRVLASPFAKMLAREAGIDISALAGKGSGPEGRVRGPDVRAFIEGGGMAAMPAGSMPTAAVATATAPFMDVPLSNMRAVIAKRLTQSKQTIPHYYLTVEIDMSQVLKARQRINKDLESEKKKLSVNDFLIKASALACLRIPECNSSYQDTFIRQYSSVDVNVAVATPNGLITPIVFGADRKGLLQINDDVLALATKARENKLQPAEFMGGTFTISNLGMWGIQSFSAIINPPQACILAVGGAEKRLVPDSQAASGSREAAMLGATLCCDHRVVDGAVGAQWLQEFKKLLENPYTMLL